jgi:hypothetical protein
MDVQSPRLAIVLNDGRWFVRHIAAVVEDGVKGEMVYHCDEHLGGPFPTPEEAVAVAKSKLEAMSN